MSDSGGDDARQLFERAAELAARAVAFDRAGHQEAAMYHYVQAAGALLEARRGGATIAHLEKRANDYLSRAEQLSETAAAAVPVHAPAADGRAEMERVFFLMSQALDADEAGQAREALQLYGQAVELCLQAEEQDPGVDNELLYGAGDGTRENKKFPSRRFTEAAEQALGRAERLKASLSAEDLENAPPPLPELDDLPELELEEPSAPPAETPPPPPAAAAGRPSGAGPPPAGRRDRPPLHRGFSSGLQVSGSDAYTKDELRVLAATSRVNDHVYVPFMAADLRERFASPLPFTDRAGPLALSPKQRRDFSRWARPEELTDEPCMIQKIDCFSIKQTCISDCSFVASLAVSALYEKRFNKPLITSIIYPRNKNNQPVYNPCGKYMVRLHINGVPRKVVIDDQLPVDRHGRLLCSYSADRRELWVSLLEKAYMKVMGGYDFPGSNSNIDLYALTGWIPERQSIRPGDAEFNADAVFRRLHDSHQKGQVLITVATGDLSEQAADRAGLVPTHAYAVLDIREVQGQRLLLLKNPWSHLRWKGNYSEMDQRHWTPSLRAALSYDPQSAQQFDNGVFWIDYESLCRFFDVFYMSWNPQLFSHTFCHHQTWSAGQGPIRDMYNIGENPQYRLEVRGPTVVWVLLSRHITEIEDFRNNKEYITVAVYKTDGSRVYYPNDPEPYMDGVRINSPHYLCKLTLKEAGDHTFTFVIAQYEKLNTIHYTLRAYSASPFALRKLGWLPTQHSVTGEWKGVTAGGCTNHPATYPNNPVYQLQLTGPAPASITLQLKGPRVYQMGMDVTCVEAASDAPGYFRRKSSGAYRSGFVVLALESVPRGLYNITPTTYMPGQEGPFILSLLAAEPAKLVRIK